jgi:hypothetical protein
VLKALKEALRRLMRVLSMLLEELLGKLVMLLILRRVRCLQPIGLIRLSGDVMNEQQLIDMADKLNEDFTWTKDPIWEHFKIHTTNKIEDDCDGYALAALYRIKGSKLKTILSFMKGESRLIWCKTSWGELHYALQYKGRYLDNIHGYWRDDLIHKRLSYVPTPIILLYLMVGKVFDKFFS